jgi:hypothetical protein
MNVFERMKLWFTNEYEKFEQKKMIWQAEEKVRDFEREKERERRSTDPFNFISLDEVPPSQTMDEREKFRPLFNNGCLKCVVPFRDGKYCAKWRLQRNEVCHDILTKYYTPVDDYFSGDGWP